MKKSIEEELKILLEDIEQYEKKNNKEIYIINIKNKIKELTNSYFKTDNIEVKKQITKELTKYYNILYYHRGKIDKHKMYQLDEDIDKLPEIYIIEQKPKKFEVNEEILKSINIEEGLTEEQALELLKWTSNNTRNNLIYSASEPNKKLDVYGNEALIGFCGLAQFSSLYPLQQLGLNITINNIRELPGYAHAFGTVTIPIRTNDKIVPKSYIIDCTYRQFFSIKYNVISRYFNTKPEAGFFINQDKEEIKFAKELLKNGFIELTPHTLEMYLKPFYSMMVDIEKTDEIDKEFKKIDLIHYLKNKQDEFDFDKEEFDSWDMNLELPKKGKKL